MKKMSVKVKITLWLTLLIGLLTVFLTLMTVSISRSVAKSTSVEQLKRTVKNNIQHVQVTDRKPEINRDFVYYQSGVSTLVYSRSGTLIAGQLPVSFSAGEAFENGVIRTIESGNSRYLVMDLWLASGWENGVWLRGIMELPDSSTISSYQIRVALITLPLFMLMAAVGGYYIVKKSFEPLDSITAAAEAISEGQDLSARIGLEPGGDEFSRLATDFDDMFQRLERSFEAEKQFTADASHELRTPVAIIKGACEYAEKYDETPQDHRETIAMIHRQADKMSRLISQLLTMTRMEQGTEKANMQKTDLGILTKEICGELAESYDRLTVSADTEVEVNADRRLLERLIVNLVENGFKYGYEGGSVWVEVSRSGNEALLAVRDDGVGIADAEQEKIWQRFYQVDSARSEESGAGLGLAMVSQIARIHGGYMTLDSKEGEGSVFTLHLPML